MTHLKSNSIYLLFYTSKYFRIEIVVADKTNAWFLSGFFSLSIKYTPNQKAIVTLDVFALSLGQFCKLCYKLRQKKNDTKNILILFGFSFFVLFSKIGLKNRLYIPPSNILFTNKRPTIFSGMQYFSSALCVSSVRKRSTGKNTNNETTTTTTTDKMKKKKQ